jgi:hypothetical protein
MIDFPLLLSFLSFFGVTILGILQWRNQRYNSQLDLSQIAKNSQDIAEKATAKLSEMQKDSDAKILVLQTKLDQIESCLQGKYELRTIVSFWPRPYVYESSLMLLAEISPNTKFVNMDD